MLGKRPKKRGVVNLLL